MGLSNIRGYADSIIVNNGTAREFSTSVNKTLCDMGYIKYSKPVSGVVKNKPPKP